MGDEASGSPAPSGIVNVNVGVLGHVDSGKTHLVRVLSTHLSTAALDKHPQSQERGMTLDLGFSSFRLPTTVPNGPELQITLVDCPGHASLFKTILGGVHIIDSVLLVVDIQKGLQPQTIECLLLAELAVNAQIVVALNKIDLIPDAQRAAKIQQVQREIRSFLKRNFTFSGAQDQNRAVQIVPVAAAPASDGSEDTAVEAAPVGIESLVEAIRETLPVPQRERSGPLCYAIDHCFSIQGNGTIVTGTVLSGSLQVGDDIEFPGLQLTKKIKSMQMFKQSVSQAMQGDRVALRVNGLDATLVERGMAITPGSLPFVRQVIIPVHQVALFQGKCKTGGKIHATVGHTTVIAVTTFFKRYEGAPSTLTSFATDEIYQAVSEIESPSGYDGADEGKLTLFDGFALLKFEQPVICPPNAIVVCARLDLDPKKFHCRLAFHGQIQAVVWEDDDEVTTSKHEAVAPASLRLGELKIGSIKSRTGVVDKLVEKGGSFNEVLAREMFAKDVDWQVYTGITVLFEQAKRLGKIVGPFGKSGKFRIELLPSRNQSLPVVGELIVLRFIKLAVLRPLKRANAKGASISSTTVPKSKQQMRNMLQEEGILYPETLRGHETKEEEAVSLPVPLAPRHESGREFIRTSGAVERLKGETTAEGRNPFVVVSGLFIDEASAVAATGRPVRVQVTKNAVNISENGEIEKPFGKAGKVRVIFPTIGGTLAQVGDVVELV